MPAVSPFNDYTAVQAREKLPARPDYADELDDFLAGDLWRASQGWIGELPTDAAALGAMARGIVGENVVLELLTRQVAGVVGKEPRWGMVPKTAPRAPRALRAKKPITGPADTLAPVAQPAPADSPPLPTPPQPPTETALPVLDDTPDARILETEDALTDWWDTRHILSILQQSAAHRGAEGRGPLWLVIPSGLRDEHGQIPKCATLADALNYIYVDACLPSQAGVYIDPKTRMGLGILTAMDEDGHESTDLTYRDENGRTVLKVFRHDAEPQIFVAALSGHLFLHDRPSSPLLNRQLIQAQKSITLTLSQLMRNINLAGHRQRDYIGAKPPGTWVAAQAGEVGAVRQSDGTYRRFVSERLLVGPSVVNFIQGNDIYDQDGKKIGVTNPNVSITDPVTVDHFERTYAIFRQSAHVQCHQAHVLMDTNAAISGISREQARADFASWLAQVKAALDDAGRWLIESVLALAAELMQTPGIFEDLRCEFGCVLNTGPLSPAEQEQIRKNVEARLVSRETAMSELGIDDVEAELQRIDAERAATTPPALLPGTPVVSGQIPNTGTTQPLAPMAMNGNGVVANG